MGPDLLHESTGNPADARAGDRLQRFLFEDDHDFTRAVVGLLSSKAAIHRFVSRGLAVIAVGLFGLTVTMFAQSAGQQQEAVRLDQISPGDLVAFNFSDMPDVLPTFRSSRGTDPMLADVSAVVNGENYTFASLFEANRDHGYGDNMSGARDLLTVQNQQNSIASLSGAGAGSGGSSGGAATSSSVASLSQQAVANVPDTGHSMTLLGLALGVVVAGNRFRHTRSRRPR